MYHFCHEACNNQTLPPLDTQPQYFSVTFTHQQRIGRQIDTWDDQVSLIIQSVSFTAYWLCKQAKQGNERRQTVAHYDAHVTS